MLRWDAGFQLSVCYLLRCVFPVSFFDKIQLGEEEVTNPLLLRKHERGLGSSSLQCALFIFQRFLAANIRTKADNQIERITMLLLLHALWKEKKERNVPNSVAVERLKSFLQSRKANKLFS